MHNGLMIILLVALTIAGLSCASGSQFFVSPNGRDSWSGALAGANRDGTDGPFATLPRAQQAARELKNTGPVEVVVQAGTYHLSAPLSFTADDSGTQTCPVTYRAQGRVVISGGEPITGWQKGEDGIWSADVPDAKNGHWNFRLLRVGNKWATRARFPNHDPSKPLTGGWLFADFHGEPWEEGRFGTGVSHTENVGSKLTWRFKAPSAGTYSLWLYYGHNMKQYGIDNLGGHTAFRLDGGEPMPIADLPDTGGWAAVKWVRVGRTELREGEHTLTWENLKGGGLNLDALVFCEDESWDPGKAFHDFTWWGTYQCDPPASGKHILIIQAEACESHEGKEIVIPSVEPPGEMAFMRFRPGDLPQWTDVSGAEVHLFPAWGWVSAIECVERIDFADRKIHLVGGAAQDIRMGNRYFIANVREALDAPGEWYLDKKTGKLLYIPERTVVSGHPCPETPDGEAVAPRLDRLIVFDGAEYVTLRGFTFTDTDYNLTREYYTPRDAAIYMSRARHCAVRDCRFEHLGGYALRLENNSHYNEFTGNDIEDMGMGGVVMFGDNSNHPHHNLVAGNVMRRLGLVYKHVAGVYVSTGDDNRIVHNTISHVTRYGISLKSFAASNSSRNNLVEYNDIRQTNLETNDTGAIETLGCNRKENGNTIRYNLILDTNGLKSNADGTFRTNYFSWGIYLDDFSSGALVYGNVVARTDLGGMCVHGGRNNTFENNVFVNSHSHQVRLQPRDDFIKGNRFVRNIVAYTRPESDLIFSYTDQTDLFSEWDNNLYWLRGADLNTLRHKNTPVGTFADWRKAGMDTHSLVADPMFLDPAHDDYRLKPDSPAYKLGFKPIPVEKIGAAYWRKHIRPDSFPPLRGKEGG